MSFRIITGKFFVVGYSPDGDSIRFKADDDSIWANLRGSRVKLNASGHAQLRLEAIDTLETHFQSLTQPPPFAKGAMKRLLELLGISGVVFDAQEKKVISAIDGTEGFIISREVEKNGRPVAFVFAGSPFAPDGSEVFVDRKVVETSINSILLDEGLAYPTFYQGLFSDLRDFLADLVADARRRNRGVWSVDLTNVGFEINSIDDITDRCVIMPKLFRRLAVYLSGGGSGEGFKKFMESSPDQVLHVPSGHITNLDTYIEENGNRLRLIYVPEELVFLI